MPKKVSIKYLLKKSFLDMIEARRYNFSRGREMLRICDLCGVEELYIEVDVEVSHGIPRQ